MDVTAFDQLLEIVGDVGAQIMAARAQLARRQFLIADIEQQQRLHAVDLAFVAAIQFVLDHVEQLTMQPLDEIEGLEIVLAERIARLRAPPLPAVWPMLSSSSPAFSRAHLLFDGKTRRGVLKGRKYRLQTRRATSG